MKIGFIGLGNLGLSIAQNILVSTGQLFVYNRTASKADGLIEDGAVLFDSVKELAAVSDIIFTVLPDDATLKSITEGQLGIAANLRKGGIHVSVSTVSPAIATELHELHKTTGTYYIASPVMGRPESAKNRKLNFLVSGDAAIIQQIHPVLMNAGASAIWSFGDGPGAANTAKLCSNFLIASAIESMAEGIALANKSGIDAKAWLGMLTETLFSSPVYINYSAILLNESFLPPAFSMKLGLKDLNLVIDQANAVHAIMPVANAVQKQLTSAVDNGLGDHDWTAVSLNLKDHRK